MYRVDIEHSIDYTFKAKSDNYEFSIDAKGKGITPPEVLLASLGSCIGVYIRKYSEGSKLGLEKFSISLEAEFSKEAAVGFKEIKVWVDLKGHKLDERRQKALLDFVKNCPVHNTLKSNPAVEIRLKQQ